MTDEDLGRSLAARHAPRSSGKRAQAVNSRIIEWRRPKAFERATRLMLRDAAPASAARAAGPPPGAPQLSEGASRWLTHGVLPEALVPLLGSPVFPDNPAAEDPPGPSVSPDAAPAVPSRPPVRPPARRGVVFEGSSVRPANPGAAGPLPQTATVARAADPDGRATAQSAVEQYPTPAPVEVPAAPAGDASAARHDIGELPEPRPRPNSSATAVARVPDADAHPAGRAPEPAVASQAQGAEAANARDEGPGPASEAPSPVAFQPGDAGAAPLPTAAAAAPARDADALPVDAPNTAAPSAGAPETELPRSTADPAVAGRAAPPDRESAPAQPAPSSQPGAAVAARVRNADDVTTPPPSALPDGTSTARRDARPADPAPSSQSGAAVVARVLDAAEDQPAHAAPTERASPAARMPQQDAPPSAVWPSMSAGAPPAAEAVAHQPEDVGPARVPKADTSPALASPAAEPDRDAPDPPAAKFGHEPGDVQLARVRDDHARRSGAPPEPEAERGAPRGASAEASNTSPVRPVPEPTSPNLRAEAGAEVPASEDVATASEPASPPSGRLPAATDVPPPAELASTLSARLPGSVDMLPSTELASAPFGRLPAAMDVPPPTQPALGRPLQPGAAAVARVPVVPGVPPVAEPSSGSLPRTKVSFTAGADAGPARRAAEPSVAGGVPRPDAVTSRPVGSAANFGPEGPHPTRPMGAGARPTPALSTKSALVRSHDADVRPEAQAQSSSEESPASRGALLARVSDGGASPPPVEDHAPAPRAEEHPQSVSEPVAEPPVAGSVIARVRHAGAPPAPQPAVDDESRPERPHSASASLHLPGNSLAPQARAGASAPSELASAAAAPPGGPAIARAEVADVRPPGTPPEAQAQAPAVVSAAPVVILPVDADARVAGAALEAQARAPLPAVPTVVDNEEANAGPAGAPPEARAPAASLPPGDLALARTEGAGARPAGAPRVAPASPPPGARTDGSDTRPAGAPRKTEAPVWVLPSAAIGTETSPSAYVPEREAPAELAVSAGGATRAEARASGPVVARVLDAGAAHAAVPPETPVATAAGEALRSAPSWTVRASVARDRSDNVPAPPEPEHSGRAAAPGADLTLPPAPVFVTNHHESAVPQPGLRPLGAAREANDAHATRSVAPTGAPRLALGELPAAPPPPEPRFTLARASLDDLGRSRPARQMRLEHRPAAATAPEIGGADPGSLLSTPEARQLLARLPELARQIPTAAIDTIDFPTSDRMLAREPVSAAGPRQIPLPGPAEPCPVERDEEPDPEPPDVDSLYDEITRRLRRELLDERERRGGLLGTEI